MNFLSEIQAFNDWLATNPTVTSDDIVLWHTLMQLNNQGRWQTEFTVAISTIIDRSRLSRSAIYRSRNRLVQLGRIRTKERPGNQCSVYQVMSFVCHTGTQTGESPGTVSPNGTHPGTQPGTQSGTQPETIKKTKQDKTKQKDASASLRALKVFVPPSLDEVKAYFRERGYTEAGAEKAWSYYDVADWKDRNGNQVRNWKQKMQGVWFKDEYKAPPQAGSGDQSVTDPQDRSRTYYLRDYPNWHPSAPFDYANITRYKKGWPLRDSNNENIPGSNAAL